jgi:hypothetical protein
MNKEFFASGIIKKGTPEWVKKNERIERTEKKKREKKIKIHIKRKSIN